MARSIQPQSNRPNSAKSVVGLLANAVFWLVMAIVIPVKAFLETIPELAPYAHWAPFLFYALAVLSVVRAARGLQHLTAGRWPASAQGRPSGGASRPADQRGAKATANTHGMPTINRKPTVQRMH
jgi:hypothetical protein